MGKRFSIRIMDGSISAERTTSDDAEKGSPLPVSFSPLFVLIPDILAKEGTDAAADVVSGDIIDK